MKTRNPTTPLRLLLLWQAFLSGVLVVPMRGAGAAPPDDAAEFESPFKVGVAWETGSAEGRPRLIQVQFQVPPNHHVYADSLGFEFGTNRLAFEAPPAREIRDRFSGRTRMAFEADFTVAVTPPPAVPRLDTLRVQLQGCAESECFFPETREWRVGPEGTFVAIDPSASGIASAPSSRLTDGFRVVARAAGYVGPQELIALLDHGSSQSTPVPEISAVEPPQQDGWQMTGTMGAILLGGLALNLTPCVLPMIPINIALIGAGVRSGNRRRGFLLGATYGASMAFAYGALGLVVVLTGAKFGALQSSPWFNFAIAGIFLVLSLAMFDRLAIDLSVWQSRRPAGARRSGAYFAAASMGSVSALLAGACVAPVVISVLLLATSTYQRGQWIGLLLPFLLGAGMALPWPFAGAGLSWLPKPGAWMNKVKYAFGVLILGFAAWYGWLGWNLTQSNGQEDRMARARKEIDSLQGALADAKRSGKPVLVDFWASWCKNCSAMEHTTFQDPAVRKKLNEVRFVRFQAEHLSAQNLEPILSEFGVLGLPTLVLLSPAATTSLAGADSAPLTQKP